MSADSGAGPRIDAQQWAEKLDALAPGKKQPTTKRNPLPWLFSTNHRILGIQYLLLSLIAVVTGTLLSLLMRIHLAWPDLALPFHGAIKPEDYLALVTMHGTLMVFFVLTVVPQSGFPNLVLPAQIGSSRMALPRLNAAAFWITAARARRSCSPPSSFPEARPSPAGPAIRPSAPSPPPAPARRSAWTSGSAAITLFCLAAWLGSVNILATILGCRCEGMTFTRLPLTVWSWLVARSLTVIAFSALLAAAAAALLRPPPRHQLLSAHRHSSSNGIPQPDGDGSPMLWLHLFWFFGHPEVYIAILPGMGLASSLLANFTRRPVPAYRLMVSQRRCSSASSASVVWGHHMFVTGMNPYAGTAFGLTTIAIAVPSSAEVLTWLVHALRRPPAPHHADALHPRLPLASSSPAASPAPSSPSRRSTPTCTTPSSSSPISISSWPWPESSPSLPASITGIPLLTGRLHERDPRQNPLLDLPHRRLRHILPHALRRTCRRAAPLCPARRNPRILRRSLPLRARHYLVRLPACRRPAYFSGQSFPQRPGAGAACAQSLAGHHSGVVANSASTGISARPSTSHAHRNGAQGFTLVGSLKNLFDPMDRPSKAVSSRHQTG